ncbi:MAG: TonB family protein [Ignavibacteriales bacterium]|nr:TonB family protein [Ignavibacteriales bacterium]
MILKTLKILLLISVAVNAQTGISKSYYPDGTLRSEISYVNDILDGPAFWYHQNGNLQTEKNYSYGKLNGYVREYFENGLLKEEYFVKDGIKDGTQRIFYDNGALKEISIYVSGLRTEVTKFDYDSSYSPSYKDFQAGNRQQKLLEKENADLICDADICPVPAGGMNAIQNNLVYPEHALLYGLEGTVILIAVINENGVIVETEIIKGIGLGCDEAASDAVKKTSFIPGQTNGVTVTSRVTLKINFVITGERKIVEDKKLAAADVVKKEEPVKEIQPEKIEQPAQEKEIKPVPSEQKTPYRKAFNIASIKCEQKECAYPMYGIKSITKNFDVPPVAKRLKLTGEIIVEANVDKYGLVTDTKLIQGIGYGCDEAFQSALLKTKFNPSKENGEAVDSKITVVYPFSGEE